MLSAEQIAPDQFRHWSRQEYRSLVERGFFGDERIELIEGTLVEMSPQGPLHDSVISRLNKLFMRALRDDVDADRVEIRIQSGFAANDESQPQPDVAVIPGGDYTQDHPSRAHLIVEVADSSLKKDLGAKATLYARSGVPEYWVVAVAAGTIEVHRNPGADGYAERESYAAGSSITPLAFPDIHVAVADVLGG